MVFKRSELLMLSDLLMQVLIGQRVSISRSCSKAAPECGEFRKEGVGGEGAAYHLGSSIKPAAQSPSKGRVLIPIAH